VVLGQSCVVEIKKNFFCVCLNFVVKFLTFRKNECPPFWNICQRFLCIFLDLATFYMLASNTGLPDFSRCVIPKPEKCTKRTQNVSNDHNISRLSVKYSEWPQNMSKYCAIKGPPKFTQIEIFGLKRNHLATLKQQRHEWS
jgi:hypothetical protein